MTDNNNEGYLLRIAVLEKRIDTLEAAMKESDWLLREAAYHRLIRDAYNEAFIEGMREHTSRRGGQPWSGSKAQQKMNELARFPQESEHVG